MLDVPSQVRNKPDGSNYHEVEPKDAPEIKDGIHKLGLSGQSEPQDITTEQKEHGCAEQAECPAHR